MLDHAVSGGVNSLPLTPSRGAPPECIAAGSIHNNKLINNNNIENNDIPSAWLRGALYVLYVCLRVRVRACVWRTVSSDPTANARHCKAGTTQSLLPF